jgi:hypothetical protein
MGEVGTMRRPTIGAVRGVVLPTVACSLVCGGAVLLLAATGVRGLDSPAAAAPGRTASRPATLPPPAAVAAPTPPEPAITQAPTATVWVVRLPTSRGSTVG